MCIRILKRPVYFHNSSSFCLRNYPRRHDLLARIAQNCRMPQSVSATNPQVIQEATVRPKKFRCFFRCIFRSKYGNRTNERPSSFNAWRPELPGYLFQSSKVLRLYQVSHHLRTGSDTEIYAGERRTDSKKVAIKVSEKSQAQEAQRHRLLLDDDVPVGVPFIYSYGWCDQSQKSYLITELLGFSLYDILERLENRRMRVKDVCMVATSVMGCLEYFHQKGVIHGNINPESILMGRLNKRSKVFLIDYKSLQPWKSQGKRIPCEQARSIVRNPYYASPRSCGTRVLTRRDDMISLSYTIIKLLKGELPWVKSCGLVAVNRVERMKGQVGKGFSVCSDLPSEIAEFIKKVHALGYTEKPDYNAYTDLFKTCLWSIGESDDNGYEWFDDPYIGH